jgi:hypothetical protein
MPRFSIEALYSINGWDELVEKLDPGVIAFLCGAVSSMDFAACNSKESKERTMQGRLLISPKKMNSHIGDHFHERGYSRYRITTFNSASPSLQESLRGLPEHEQRRLCSLSNVPVYEGFKEADFYAYDNLFEIQFGKYPFVLSDKLKAIELIQSGIAKTAAIILPMKSLQDRMSSGPAYYEGALSDMIRRDMHKSIQVPIALIGIGVSSEITL